MEPLEGWGVTVCFTDRVEARDLVLGALEDAGGIVADCGVVGLELVVSDLIGKPKMQTQPIGIRKEAESTHRRKRQPGQAL